MNWCNHGFRQDNLDAFEYQRLVEWIKDGDRKPAVTAFTSGILRDCARAFETAVEGNEGK